MASDGEVSSINDPNFAVICSFLDVFSKLCAIEPPSILQLQELIENTQEVLEPLKELHLKLLRRSLKNVHSDRWEKFLIKFCHQQSHHQEAWELERFGYKKASTTVKLKVLKILLEYQFTCHTKFKSAVNQLESSEIRLNPVGRDNQGRNYWLLVDFDANLRLYREDHDKETWKLIASDRAGYVKVINMLKSGESIEGAPESEDSNSLEGPLNPDTTENPENENEEFLSPESESDDEDNINEKNAEAEKLSESVSETMSQVLNNCAEDNACSSPPQSLSNKFETHDDEKAQKDRDVQKRPLKEKKEILTVEKITLKLGSGKDANFEIKNDDVTSKTLLDKQNILEECTPSKRAKNEPAKEENENIIDSTSEKAKIEISSEKEKYEPSAENDDDSEIGEEIEEPLMLIQGEGEGADCDSPPFFVGEEICEPVFYTWGSGYGNECETGNPSLSASDKVQLKESNKSENDRLRGCSKKFSKESSENSEELVKSEQENNGKVTGKSSTKPSAEVNAISQGASLGSVSKDMSDKDIVSKSPLLPDTTPSTSSNSFRIENLCDISETENVDKEIEQEAKNQHADVENEINADKSNSSENVDEEIGNRKSDAIVNNIVNKRKTSKLTAAKKSKKNSPVKSGVSLKSDTVIITSHEIKVKDPKIDQEKKSDTKVEADVESNFKENGLVKITHKSVPNSKDDEKVSDGKVKSKETLKTIGECSSQEDKKSRTDKSERDSGTSDNSHTLVRRPSTEKVLPGIPDVKKCRAESQESVDDQKKNSSEDDSGNAKKKSICDSTDESCSKNYKKAESPSKEETASKIDKIVVNKVKIDTKKIQKETKKITKLVSDKRKMVSKKEVIAEKDPLDTEIKQVDRNSSNAVAPKLNLGISDKNADARSENSSDTDFKTDVKIHGKHKADSDIKNDTIKPCKVELNPLPTKKLKLDSTSDENDKDHIDNNSKKILNTKVVKDTADSSDDNQPLSDPLNIESTSKEDDNSKSKGDSLDDSGIQMKKFRVEKQNAKEKKPDGVEKLQEGRTLRHTKNTKLPEKKSQLNVRKKGRFTKIYNEKCKQSDDTEDSSDKTVEKNEIVPKKRDIILTIKERGKRKVIKKQLVQKEDTSEKKISLKRGHQDNNLLGKRTREQSESLSDHDQDDVLAGKRAKMKPKKVILSTRKKIEEKLKLLKETSDDDTESSEDALVKARDKSKNTSKKMTPKGKSKATPTKGKGSSATKATQKKKDSLDEIDPSEDLTPVRMSRRIAQLKIREEADRRQLEEIALRELKAKHTKESQDSKDDKGDVDWRDSSADRVSVNSNSQGPKGKPKKEKKGKDQKWGSSSGGSDSESEPEPLFEHEEHEVVEVQPKSDHEFSPESDLENGEVAVPTRRARTLKKGDEAEDADGACGACGGRDQPEWILLCDACDAGRHASCLKPILFVIPEGNWYCPPCDHERLINSLEESLVKYDRQLTAVKRQQSRKGYAMELMLDKEEKKKEDDKSSGSSDESSSGDSDSTSGSDDGKVYRLRERRQLPVSYRFKEYDQLISSAIKEEYRESPSTAGNQGRGKDISTIIEADKEEKQKAKIQAQMDADQKDPPESEVGGAGVAGGAGSAGGAGGGKEEAELKRQERARAAAHRRRPRKLNSLEVISDDDDNSDEDFKEAGYSSSTSSTAEEGAEDSDSSHSSDSLPIRRSARSSKKSRRKIVESPELKKKKRIFDDTSSSESSGAKDWSSRKKKKKSRHQHSSGHSHKSRSRKKRSPRPPGEKMKKCTVKYGGLSGSEESNGWSPAHRTRQKKINYTEMPNTESEDEVHKPSGKHMPDSSDEYKVDSDSSNSDSDKSNKKRKVGNSSDEEKKDKPQTLSEMLKEHLENKDGEETKKEEGETKKEDDTPSSDSKAVLPGDADMPVPVVGISPNKPLRGRGSRGPRGGRGSRGPRGGHSGRGSHTPHATRGARSGRGGGGGLNKVLGAGTVQPGSVENVTSADGSTMQGLVGMKIKDLTQSAVSVEGAESIDGAPVVMMSVKPAGPTPFQLEREKKRLEREVRMAEKELKKQERMKKKEEKDQQKEMKAREREEKKIARAEQQSKKKKTNELMQPIPIAGMMQNAGARVPGPPAQHLPANSISHNAMKPGLSVRPFIGQMSTRDGQPHNFHPRGSMDGMRAYGPPGHHYFAGQHSYPAQEGMRHRFPGMTGSRGELMGGPRGELMGGPRGEFMAGPRGEMTRLREEHTMGPRGQFSGPRGEMIGPRGEFTGPRGEFTGPRGEFTGPRDDFAGPRREFTGARGEFSGPRGEFSGPRGEFTGPRGEFPGPRGEFNGPRGEFGGPRGQFTGSRGDMIGPRGQFVGPRGEIIGPRGQMMGPRGEMTGHRGESPGPRREFMGPRGGIIMGPRGEIIPPPDSNETGALANLGRLAGEDRQTPLKYPVDNRGISPHSSGSDSNPGSSGEHLRGMLTAPGQQPRLQVRAELRGLRPDFSNVSGGGGERRRGRGANRKGAGRGSGTEPGEEDVPMQGRSTPGHEGTLSVAGSPQPFKPAIDPPSIITRMPHMMPPHFRGSSMYAGNGPMYGSPRGLPPQMAMYRTHQPHPMDPSPTGGGPLQRSPYPSGAYYPPQMHGGAYPMRYPAPYQPEALPEENQQPKVKFEIKTEPGFQTPPHGDVDSASPHSQDGPSRHLSPPPAKRTPPPQGAHEDQQRALPAHPKVKHTDNKDRARARMTTATRYPHGPYAPQYGPYGPYAPPSSRPEYPPPTMSPSAPTSGPPVTSAPGVPSHLPPPLSHQPPSLSHQPPPLCQQPPPLSHQPSPLSHRPSPLSHQTPPPSHQTPPISHQPPPHSHKPPPHSHPPPPLSHQPLPISHQPAPPHPPPPHLHQPEPSHQLLPHSHQPPIESHQTPLKSHQPPLQSHQTAPSHPPPSHSHPPPPLLQANMQGETNQSPLKPNANSASSEAPIPAETDSNPTSESNSAPLSLTVNRRTETPPTDASLSETKTNDKIPVQVSSNKEDCKSPDVENLQRNKFTPASIMTDQNDDTSESTPAEEPNPRIQTTEEEGEFGGLVSYFSSQQEDDIDN